MTGTLSGGFHAQLPYEVGAITAHFADEETEAENVGVAE